VAGGCVLTDQETVTSLAMRFDTLRAESHVTGCSADGGGAGGTWAYPGDLAAVAYNERVLC
jgi:hypothetical protein